MNLRAERLEATRVSYETERPTEIMITVEQLEFTYPGVPDRVLKGFHFEVRRGEIFGFLGPSRAGKSTTQNILIGLLRGYQGSVSILGRELEGWGPDYYEQIGVSFELPTRYLKLSARARHLRRDRRMTRIAFFHLLRQDLQLVRRDSLS